MRRPILRLLKSSSCLSLCSLAATVASVPVPLTGAVQPAPFLAAQTAATNKIEGHNPGFQPLQAAGSKPKINTLPCAVSGTVRDASGTAVPNTIVYVIETATGATQTINADGAGHYCASGLSEGRYSISFEHSGFRMTRVDALTVAVNRTTLADVSMPPIPQFPQSHEPIKVGASHIFAPSIPSPATPTPPPTHPTPPAHSDQSDPEAALGIAEAKWFAQLPNGSIEYGVAPTMTVGKPSTVSVTIDGYKAPPLPSTGSGAPAALKVSEWMRVEATQPNNPDEFTISSDPIQNPQFVPIDAGATWTWTVTPNHLGRNQKLQFQAFVLYKDDTSKVQRALPSAEKTITVQAEGVSGIVGQIDDNFWTNPLNWFKYMLPGGAGFAALVGLISWWIKSRKKEEPAKPGE